MKVILVLALVGVLVALGSAGLFMLRKPPARDAAAPADRRMARALAVRVGLSVALFLFVMLAWHLGWIAPKGLPTGR